MAAGKIAQLKNSDKMLEVSEILLWGRERVDF